MTRVINKASCNTRNKSSTLVHWLERCIQQIRKKKQWSALKIPPDSLDALVTITGGAVLVVDHLKGVAERHFLEEEEE